MSKVLASNFFARPVLEVAPQLLGKYLVIKANGQLSAYRITEVEAYEGETDLASHARVGKTHRNSVMYGPPGNWYIYLIYGIYWMLNIVCEAPNHPAAVLIRGVDGIAGPGKLTTRLGINNSFNNQPAHPKTGLWIEDRGEKLTSNQIKATPRIGIDYAGPVWSQKHYRFILNSSN